MPPPSKHIKPLALKTGVNTRAPLADRLPGIDHHTHEHNKWVTKRGAELSTYGEATSSAYIKSGKDVPPRFGDKSAAKDLTLKSSTGEAGSEWNASVGGLNGSHGGANASVGSAPVARLGIEAPTMSIGSWGGAATHNTALLSKTSTAFASSCNTLANDPDTSFYSRVRKVERMDDAARHGLEVLPTRSGAARMQRTVDLLRKRETDPSFCPRKMIFEPIERRLPNGIPAPTALETVRFTYVMPESTMQIDYKEPDGRIRKDLDQGFQTQRRVMSETGSSRDLFSGTPKSRAEVLPGYMSHVPAAPSNLAKLNGDADVLKAYTRNGFAAGQTTGIPGHATKDLALTTQGFAQLQAASFPEETKLNKVMFGKKTAVFN